MGGGGGAGCVFSVARRSSVIDVASLPCSCASITAVCRLLRRVVMSVILLSIELAPHMRRSACSLMAVPVSIKSVKGSARVSISFVFRRSTCKSIYSSLSSTVTALTIPAASAGHMVMTWKRMVVRKALMYS